MGIKKSKNILKNVFTKENTFIFLFPKLALAKRIKDKAKAANFSITFNRYFMLMFVTLFSLLFFQSAYAITENPITGERIDYILSGVLEWINPDIVDGELSESYAPKELGINLALIMAFATSSAVSLIAVTMYWFGLKFLLDKVMGVNNINTSSRALAFVILALASSQYTKEVDVHGYKVQKSYLQITADKAIREALLLADSIATTNYDKPVSVPSYKVISPKHLSNDFVKILNVYLMSGSKTEQLTDTVSIEFSDNLYRIEFEMGGSKTKITYKSGVALNKLASELFGVDLLIKEQEFVRRLTESQFKNAVAVANKLKNIDFSHLKTTSDSQDIENIRGKRLSFADEYQTYCENIYEYPLAGSDIKSIQKYNQITALCAAESFLTEQYQNSFYKAEDVYAKTSILRPYNTPLFGEIILTTTYEEVVKHTLKSCDKDSGYMHCAEAIQFTSQQNIEKNKELGVLVFPVSIVNELAGSVYDASDKILKDKIFEQEEYRTIAFNDLVLEERSLFDIKFQLNQTKNPEIVANPFDLYDISQWEIPTLEQIFRSITGSKITEPYERVRTCLYHFDSIFDGFKCQNPRKELVKFGTGFGKTAFAILATGAATSQMSTSSKFTGAVLGGGASKLGKVAGVAGAGAASMLIPSMMTNPTKDDPYYSQETASAIVFTSYLISFYNAEFTEHLFTLAMMMLLISAGILILVFGIYIHLFLYFVGILLELIIDSKMLILLLFTRTLDDGFKGMYSVLRSMVVELTFLILIVYMMKLMPEIQDWLLLDQFESIFEVTRAMEGSIENILTGIPKLLMLVVTKVIVLTLVVNFITGMLDKSLEQMKTA